ncbi:ORF391 [White spot syndrome virus]|uniref:ORF391 n=1 Tax=White spot syndrome virus TaxID=342409 RepID=A0A2D3I517_9VIRU|nr:ORF391 [White spot syndrome virus]
MFLLIEFLPLLRLLVCQNSFLIRLDAGKKSLESLHGGAFIHWSKRLVRFIIIKRFKCIVVQFVDHCAFIILNFAQFAVCLVLDPLHGIFVCCNSHSADRLLFKHTFGYIYAKFSVNCVAHVSKLLKTSFKFKIFTNYLLIVLFWMRSDVVQRTKPLSKSNDCPREYGVVLVSTRGEC